MSWLFYLAERRLDHRDNGWGERGDGGGDGSGEHLHLRHERRWGFGPFTHNTYYTGVSLYGLRITRSTSLYGLDWVRITRSLSTSLYGPPKNYSPYNEVHEIKVSQICRQLGITFELKELEKSQTTLLKAEIKLSLATENSFLWKAQKPWGFGPILIWGSGYTDWQSV